MIRKFSIKSRGFTLVELMIVVAIIGVLSTVAIPSFMKYIRRSKTTEATMNIRKIFESTVSYYQTEHASATGTILAKQFPATVAATPVITSCCSQTGQKCAPVATLWTSQTWQALNFSMDDPHYYSYAFTQSTGTGAAVGDQFNADASGDLDCDTTYSLFRRSGTVSADFSVSGGSGMYSQNDIE